MAGVTSSHTRPMFVLVVLQENNVFSKVRYFEIIGMDSQLVVMVRWLSEYKKMEYQLPMYLMRLSYSITLKMVVMIHLDESQLYFLLEIIIVQDYNTWVFQNGRVISGLHLSQQGQLILHDFILINTTITTASVEMRPY